MGWFRWRRAAESAAENETERTRPRPFFLLGGRRHLASAPDLLPKDEQEINRLDFQHFLLRNALQGNYAAPLQRPSSILDVGTGTGRWAQEMATLFPSARVVGVDIVDLASNSALASYAPPNYTFALANILEPNGLPFADGAFDYVHQRFLFTAIPAASWPTVVNELARVTRPRGWVELTEGGLIRGGGAAIQALQQWAIAASARRGIDFGIGGRIEVFLRGAGLRDVTRREVSIPLGRQGGRVGRMMESDYFSAVSGLRGPMVMLGVTTAAEFDRTIEAARLEAARLPAAWPIHIAYARQP